MYLHLIKYVLSTLDFLAVSNLKSMIYLYYGSENFKYTCTDHANINMAIYMHAEISIISLSILVLFPINH